MSYGSDAYCRAEHEQLQRAVRAGVVAVAAAGNEFADGNPLEYPATLPHVLTVAATARDDRATGFSSASAAVDLSAPGIGIVTGVAAAFDADGTPDGYAALDGTSFSAPMVAAAVAWVRAARPELSPYQVAQVVRLGARDVGAAGWDADTGFGVLTLAGALARTAPQNDLGEPNDEFELVNGRAFGAAGAAFLQRGAPEPDGRARPLRGPGRPVPGPDPRAHARAHRRVAPTFGDPDLYLYDRRATRFSQARYVIARSARRGAGRAEALLVGNRSPRARTAYVAVGIRLDARTLDAGYRLTIRPR